MTGGGGEGEVKPGGVPFEAKESGGQTLREGQAGRRVSNDRREFTAMQEGKTEKVDNQETAL